MPGHHQVMVVLSHSRGVYKTCRQKQTKQSQAVPCLINSVQAVDSLHQANKCVVIRPKIQVTFTCVCPSSCQRKGDNMHVHKPQISQENKIRAYLNPSMEQQGTDMCVNWNSAFLTFVTVKHKPRASAYASQCFPTLKHHV